MYRVRKQRLVNKGDGMHIRQSMRRVEQTRPAGRGTRERKSRGRPTICGSRYPEGLGYYQVGDDGGLYNA